MILHLQIAGWLLVVLASAHGFFPRHFRWREDLKTIPLLTREIFYVHHFFVALTVGLMGLILILEPVELYTSALGKKILVGFAIFWGTRLFFQFFVYSSTHWRGKTFETVMHILFVCLWIYLTAVCAISAWH